MPPHSNGAELETCDAVVLHRNVCHQLSTQEGRSVFSVLASVARTCHKMGVLPRITVENVARDPDRSIFKPPPEQGRAESVAPIAAVY